jgi:hypothetical protein
MSEKEIVETAFKASKEGYKLIVLPVGTALVVRTATTFGTDRNRSGDIGDATLEQPLTFGERAIMQRGTLIKVRVASIGTHGGQSEISLQLTEIVLPGINYRISAHWNQVVSGRILTVPAQSVLQFSLDKALTIDSR